MIYTVGEMAKKLNVTALTLRYYDKEGLLPFVERSSGGIRMFKDEDLPGLKMIECLKKTGMPIRDIKHFMDCSIMGDTTIEERLSIIRSQRDAVIQQIQEMQEMLEMLNFKCWYYEAAKEAGTCAIHDSNNIQLEKIPKEYHKFINAGSSF
ncbi:MerR family transcriptional regulator [Dehalobacter sp. DCM]|uniref:MerR family transcriptional regulator n=1 Tax=Dehalobacter sp. DCM TaxID=2907827 RepID=UPI0030819E27|nr:MerR family transcriptional regulator [Dehalobacter sp. DCM]